MGLPGGPESCLIDAERRLEGPVGLGDEGLDLKVAADDKGRHGGLDPAYAQRAAVISIPFGELGVEARHVHTVEPVCLTASPGGVAVAFEILVGLELAQCPSDGLGIGVSDKEAHHRPIVIAELKYLINEKLAFPVAVPGVDYGIRLFEQGLQILKQVLAILLNEHLPLRRDDGQVIDTPALVFLIVLIGRALFEDVTGGPRQHIIPCLDIEPGGLLRLGEDGGDGAGKAWFLGYKETHKDNSLLVLAPKAWK